MGIASITKRVVEAAFGGVLGLASKRRPQSDEWIVECPETETTTAVTLDAAGRVTGCSHWPQREGCDQSCAGEQSDTRADMRERATAR
jgi:hypothetical protein